MEVHAHAHDGQSTTAYEEDADQPTPAPRVRQVLHVEDDEDLRWLCAEILEDAGFEVVGCSTVMAAKLAVGARLPDVLLVDRDLPDGSGLELVRWARSQPSCAGVHVIVFSARRSREDVQSAITAGCDAFLGKPCAPDMLVETVEAMVRPEPEPDAGTRRTGRRLKYVPSP